MKGQEGRDIEELDLAAGVGVGVPKLPIGAFGDGDRDVGFAGDTFGGMELIATLAGNFKGDARTGVNDDFTGSSGDVKVVRTGVADPSGVIGRSFIDEGGFRGDAEHKFAFDFDVIFEGTREFDGELVEVITVFGEFFFENRVASHIDSDGDGLVGCSDAEFGGHLSGGDKVGFESAAEAGDGVLLHRCAVDLGGTGVLAVDFDGVEVAGVVDGGLAVVFQLLNDSIEEFSDLLIGVSFTGLPNGFVASGDGILRATVFEGEGIAEATGKGVVVYDVAVADSPGVVHEHFEGIVVSVAVFGAGSTDEFKVPEERDVNEVGLEVGQSGLYCGIGGLFGGSL